MNIKHFLIAISAVFAVGAASTSDYQYQSLLESIRDYQRRIVTLEAQIQTASGSERQELRGRLRIYNRILNNFEKDLKTLERSFSDTQKAPAVNDDAGRVMSPDIIEGLIKEKEAQIRALTTQYSTAPKKDLKALRTQIIGLFDEIRSLRMTLRDIKTANTSDSV